jgi:hypothetical protein
MFNRSLWPDALSRVRLFTLAAALCLLAFKSKAASEADGQLDRIVDAELAKQFTDDGFKTSPSQIDLRKSPEYRNLEEASPSIWKRADARKGAVYAAKQKAVNDRLRPEAKAVRAPLLEAFQSAAALSGGGSASSALMNLSAAETEWIIANLAKEETEETPDLEFLRQLRAHAATDCHFMRSNVFWSSARSLGWPSFSRVVSTHFFSSAFLVGRSD